MAKEFTSPVKRLLPRVVDKDGRMQEFRADSLGIGYRPYNTKRTMYRSHDEVRTWMESTDSPQLNVEKVSKDADIPSEIKRILTAHPGLHFAQIQEKLRHKSIELDRRMAGTILQLLKKSGEVKQEGFHYTLVKKGA